MEGGRKKQIISSGDCTQLKGEVETDHCDGVQIEAETAVIYSLMRQEIVEDLMLREKMMKYLKFRLKLRLSFKI